MNHEIHPRLVTLRTPHAALFRGIRTMNSGNDHQSSSSSNTIQEQQQRGNDDGNKMLLHTRTVGRIRRYNEQTKSYRKWEDIVYTTTANTNYNHSDDGRTNQKQRIVIELHRGGKLTLYPNILPMGKQRTELQFAMRTCKLYRQYTRSQVYYEPRFHVLLSQQSEVDHVSSSASSSTTTLLSRGYSYHGVSMKAQPITLVPAISTYAIELATMYNLPHQTWDIGVDCIIYRDGHDSIGWHADDSQGESIILCVVIAHSPSSSSGGDCDSSNTSPRSVHIRPKNTNTHGRKNKCKNNLQEGDEEIQLYIHEGDGYDMDGHMQCNYEHCVPKKCNDTSHRFVLIFRHGNVASVPIDSGVALTDLASSVQDPGGIEDGRIVVVEEEEEDYLSFKENGGIHDCKDGNNNSDEDVTSLFSRLRVKRPLVAFGHPPIHNSITEGALYTRRHLYSTYAHRADQRGVNGNMVHGCDSIVVSRQSWYHREEDGLCWLRYTSNRSQGGGALLISFVRQLPIRVFRSSKINNTLYSPQEFIGGKTSYRYDGLYVVTRVWDQTGQVVVMTGRVSGGGEKEEDLVKKFPGDGIQYTFHLERLLCKSSLPTRLTNDVGNTNELSINELWTKIQISNATLSLQLPFVPPIPTYLEILPELMNNVQMRQDVNCPTINVPTPLQQLQHNRQSLISSQWRVCNSSLEFVRKNHLYDDTCLTSSIWSHWSHNNMPLQQSLVSPRWKVGSLQYYCPPLVDRTQYTFGNCNNQQQKENSGKTIRNEKRISSLSKNMTKSERFDTLMRCSACCSSASTIAECRSCCQGCSSNRKMGESVVDRFCDNRPKLLLRRKQSNQIFQVWLDNRKKDWCTKQERRVENEQPKLTYNVKDRLLNNEISIFTSKNTRSNEFHERKWKRDQTKRKAKGRAVQATYDLTVDAIDEIETFCYSIILVEHWRHSFHITSGAIIALESFAFESNQAIFDCIAVKKRKRSSRVKANVHVKRSVPEQRRKRIFESNVTTKRKRKCRSVSSGSQHLHCITDNIFQHKSDAKRKRNK